ncbi:MAG: extracellular solute-binding protein [Acidimicrobiales bacterium]|nr:extracellular solute-binding protein [Acidimicrobiales bacterium]
MSTPPLRVALPSGTARRGVARVLGEVGIAATILPEGTPADLACVSLDAVRGGPVAPRSLDGLVDPLVVGGLAPAAVRRCQVGGRLLALPRTFDVRLWWARRDQAPHPPESWAELALSGLVAGVPGTGPALFQVFAKLVTSHGGRLVDDELRPTLATPEGEQALDLLLRIAAPAGPALAGWDDETVAVELAEGRLALAGVWAGATPVLRAGPAYEHLDPHLVPAGPAGRRSWARGLAWVVPRGARDVDAAVSALDVLAGAEAARHDLAEGLPAAHVGAAAAEVPADASDARRIAIVLETAAHYVVPALPLARLGAVEAAAWPPLHEAVAGRLDAPAALAAADRAARKAAG